jgi:cell division protein FtsA
MNTKEQPIIVGLDIGTTKVVAIAGRKNEYGKLEILGFGLADSQGVSHGVVLNIEQCIRSIDLAINNCLKSNPNLDVKEVYVGIAGKHIKSMQTRGDRVRNDADIEISKEDIELLIRDQQQTYIPAGDKIIDIIPQEFNVDGTTNIVDPVGMSGVKIGANFHIITADRNAIKNITRCVQRANLLPRDLILQPLASALAVMTDDDLEAGVAIVDIGGGTTDMAVFYEGILKHTCVIPFGGVNITEDIKTGLNVLRAQAEQMKVHYGSAIPQEANPNAFITIPGLKGLPAREISVTNLAHIIEARMVEILEHVLLQLKQAGLEKRLMGGIILTGGGSQLKHLKQLTEFVTGIGTRIGLPNEHLTTGEHSKKLMNPSYATCIGLILRGYHEYETGSMRFVGDHGGNGIIAAQPAIAQVVEAPPPVAAAEEFAVEPEIENDAQADVAKGPNKFNNLMDKLRTGIFKFFEEIDDQDLNKIKN